MGPTGKDALACAGQYRRKAAYCGWGGPDFVFASELKAIRAYPDCPPAVCREALAQYLRFAYVPAPSSIYPGVYKLEPGCILTMSGRIPSAAPANPLRPGESFDGLSIPRYWSLGETVAGDTRCPMRTNAHGVQLVADALEPAVAPQMMADVPLGAFLSGGIYSSSTIVALMQRQVHSADQNIHRGVRRGGT